jgi:hypothetical protein
MDAGAIAKENKINCLISPHPNLLPLEKAFCTLIGFLCHQIKRPFIKIKL